MPAADFARDELLYLPRNLRAHRLYGFSPVEQIALTVNIALRRDAATLSCYRAGSVPDAFATLPKDWTVDQIRQFQDYFDALMSGNLTRRRMVKFMPSEFRLIEARQPPLKDQYDEWLARVICYAFSVPASAFVAQVNRATSETLRMQATQEGLVPLKAWIKSALDEVIRVYLNAPGVHMITEDRMPTVNVSSDAMGYIESTILQHKSARLPDGNDIPLLAWASKAYFDDKAGTRTVYGPYFTLSWTNAEEVKRYDYLTLSMANDRLLALAPGDLFRTKPRSIEREGNKIVLVPGD